jgi:hypothetical protein
MLGGVDSMAAREFESLVRLPFIFSGRVERTAAATLPSVPVDDATVVVRVERVFRAPELFDDQTGRTITIQLRKADVKRGARALFFATGWLYGESIAVTEVGRASADDENKLAGQLGDAESRAAESELLERVAAASLVVVGKVGRIAPPQKPEPTGESEHEPDWFVAEIEVESVEKGRHPANEPALLAFPTSDDVQWYWRPKPQQGQEGVWILHREKLLGLPPGTFTALDPRDFQRRDQLENVRRLVARVR